MYTHVGFVFSLAAVAQITVAETSLYIPGFDPQPVAANEQGVGADGATTWLIAPGQPSGTLSELGFYGPATLVLSPSGANLVYNEPALGVAMSEQCTYEGTALAVCTDVFVQTGVTTMDAIETEAVQPFAVQTGAALASSSFSFSGASSGSSSPSAGGVQPTQTTVVPLTGSGGATPGGTAQSTPAGPAGTASGSSAGTPASSSPSGFATSSQSSPSLPSGSSAPNPATSQTPNGAVGSGISSLFCLGIVGILVVARIG